jgi:hypothetical protein
MAPKRKDDGTSRELLNELITERRALGRSQQPAPPRQTAVSVDLMHSRILRIGAIKLGAGFEQLEDEVSGNSDRSGRAYLQWRSRYWWCSSNNDNTIHD